MKMDEEVIELKKQIETEEINFKLSMPSEQQTLLLSSEQTLERDLFDGKMRPAQTVFCVERHQRTKVGYLSPDTKACEWGQNRENATSCGDCPFGVKLMEFSPTNDSKIILVKLKREKEHINKIYI